MHLPPPEVLLWHLDHTETADEFRERTERELSGDDARTLPLRYARDGRRHRDFREAVELLEEMGRESPGRVRFIHLNHTNPALNDEDLQDEIRSKGFPVAEVGERTRI